MNNTINNSAVKNNTSGVSVITPSRMQRNPVCEQGGLLVERAYAAVRGQSASISLEFIVGLDWEDVLDASTGKPHTEVHAVLPVSMAGASVAVRPSGQGQAVAINTAVNKSSQPILAFLEDDDV